MRSVGKVREKEPEHKRENEMRREREACADWLLLSRCLVGPSEAASLPDTPSVHSRG